ncbi:MAG: energy-coupling factor transporter transmembrane protein EcfT [Lachnospiraceae bacterium]|nr:energy-coupling factor transporter transmembrane protein EcfT [Lachnospiraceae bacterium]
MKEITLGQYYPSGSLIHRLDPRVKLLATLIYIVTLFICPKWQGVFISALWLVTIIRISKVPFLYMARQLKVVIVVLIIASVFNLFLTDGEALVQLGRFSITKEGIWQAFFIAVRLIMLVMGTSLLTFTATPNELTDGMETGLRFLKKIRVPVHEIAMMMSIALRFIPILVEEADKIMKAQKARGADFESGSIFKKAKNLIPLLVPLFVASFRRADDLALAMDALCYHGGEGRTKLHPLVYTRADKIAYVILFAYLAVIILIRIFL